MLPPMFASQPLMTRSGMSVAGVRWRPDLPWIPSDTWCGLGATVVREAIEPLPPVPESTPPATPPPRLSGRARDAMRLRHFSSRTEDAYLGWMRRYHEFHGRRDPAKLGPEHVTAFLNALAIRDHVAAATQNQALAALLFLYREVLGIQLPWLDDLVHAKTPARLPVVLTRDEVRAVLVCMESEPRLMATLLYGCGLRLLECCRLRVKDVDFGRHQITVRRGKGDKDRATMLPLSIKSELAAHLERVRLQHHRDLAAGAGWVELPTHSLASFLSRPGAATGCMSAQRRPAGPPAALLLGLPEPLVDGEVRVMASYDRRRMLAPREDSRLLQPNAGREWPWQWVFPATRHYVEPTTGQKRRHHLHETVVQHAVRRAVLASGHPQACDLPHLPPFLRHAPPRGR